MSLRNRISAAWTACRDGRSASLSAVVGLGQSLGLVTVAEGVEDVETAAMLRALGCDVGQGWLFGRPGSAEAAGKLLQRCHAERHQCGEVDSPVG